MNIKLIYMFLVGILFILFINFNALFSYFSQDDFFHLNTVADKELTDITGFFILKQAEYAFYRPLSRETFNLIMYKLFNLNPFPYHLVNLFLIVAIGVLLFQLAHKIFKNQITASIAVLIYLLSSVHNVEIYYLASVQTLLATFFILLCTLFYLIFKASQKQKFYILSIISFSLAIFSHEIAITLPIILLILEIFLYKKVSLHLIWYFLISFIYLISTSLFTSLPPQSVYQPIFNLKTFINSLGWYILWSFGISEVVVDFVGPKFTVNANFIKWYPWYVQIVVPALFFLFASIITLLVRYKKFAISLGKTTLLICLFLVSISPFLLFPQKKFIYYLELPLVWFSLLLATFLAPLYQKKFLRFWAIFFILGLFIISYQTSKLNKITYWAAKRATAAKALLTDVKNTYPHPVKSTIFYFKNDPHYPFIADEWGSSSKQAFYILSGANALQLLFNDKSVKVYFEDINPLPNDFNDKALPVLARFPY